MPRITWLFSPNEEKVFIGKKHVGYIYPVSGTKSDWGCYTFLLDSGSEGGTKSQNIEEVKGNHQASLRTKKRKIINLQKQIKPYI
jgi:hypothetical protein